MSEISNINATLETIKNYGKEVNAAAKQEKSGLKTVAQSVWDTTSTIATTAIDGTVKVVEGTADVAVGIFKETAAVAKLPFELTSSLFKNSKAEEKTNEQPMKALQDYATDYYLNKKDDKVCSDYKKHPTPTPKPPVPLTPDDTLIDDPLQMNPTDIPIVEDNKTQDFEKVGQQLVKDIQNDWLKKPVKSCAEKKHEGPLPTPKPAVPPTPDNEHFLSDPSILDIDPYPFSG